MAEIVLGLLGPAIEVGKCIVAPNKRQLIYLCCFNSNVKSLDEEAKKLEDERAGLQMEVDTEINNAQMIDAKVETWLKEVNDIQKKRRRLEMEIANVQGGSCLSVKSRYSVSRTIVKTAEEMKQKLADRRDITVISHRPPPASRVSNILERRTSEFESRKKLEEYMMANLKDENVKIMGMCGMGGVGKTTLAEKIKNRVGKENVFGESVMVVVSQPADKQKIQGDIAEKLGLKLEESSLSNRAERLCRRLMGGKRILIVLDDVWEYLDLKELGIPCESGCTILLTSRDRGVLARMNAQPILEMQILNREEALSFFKEKLGTHAVDQNQFSSLAKDIANECKGLPLVLTTVAGALKGQMKIYVWEDALRDLRRSSPEDLQDVLKEVYTPLKLSYDYLSSQNVKSVFLLCCLFPEDSNILLEDLFAFVVGLRMFEGIEDLGQARDKTCSLVEMLKSRFLLLEGRDERYVRMHDVVRDVVIFIASKEKRLIKCGDKSTWISRFLGEKIELPSESTFPNLRLLMIKNFQISDISFEKMKGLNVLSVSCGFPFKSLPHMTQSLHTLILENSKFLKTICPVGELINLEILICRNCNSIEELPSETIRLKRLRLLEISNCNRLQKIQPGVISSLDKLEELKMMGSFNNWEAENEEKENKNVCLSELKSLSNLTCLEIQVWDSKLATQQFSLSPKIEKYQIIVGAERSYDYPREFQKTMHLCLPQEITSMGKWLQERVASIECLVLEGPGSNCLDLGAAQNIRWLTFQHCSTVSFIVRCGATVVFPLLESIHLKELNNLEELCDIDVPNSELSSSSSNDSFKNLKELRLEDLSALKRLWKTSSSIVSLYSNLSSITLHRCKKLVNLVSLSSTRDCFPQLELLTITHCGDMEKVFLWKEEKEKNNGLITFPKLKTLVLRNLQSLKVFCQGIESIEFPLLTKIRIKSCPQLKVLVPSSHVLCKDKISNINNTLCPQMPIGRSFTHLEELTIDKNCGSIKSLFSFSIAKNLDSLKVLTIEDCEEMEKVIEEEGEECSSSSSTLVFGHLERLYLHALPKLKVFCNSALRLPKLKTLDIYKCPELGGFNLASPNLESLEKVRITSCEMVFLWREQSSRHHITFPKLKELSLDNLPRLTSFYKGIQSIEFPLPTQLFIRGCPNLKSLVPTTTSSINNEVVEEQTIHFLCSSLWDQIPVGNFTRLEQLIICDYEEISSLFSSSVAANLINVKVLKIRSCKNMVKVIEDEVEMEHSNETRLLFPHLEHLSFDDLPKLKIFCDWKCGLELPSLVTLYIYHCPKIERFSLGSLTTPKLRTIRPEGVVITTAEDLNSVLHQLFISGVKL